MAAHICSCFLCSKQEVHLKRPLTWWHQMSLTSLSEQLGPPQKIYRRGTVWSTPLLQASQDRCCRSFRRDELRMWPFCDDFEKVLSVSHCHLPSLSVPGLRWWNREHRCPPGPRPSNKIRGQGLFSGGWREQRAPSGSGDHTWVFSGWNFYLYLGPLSFLSVMVAFFPLWYHVLSLTSRPACRENYGCVRRTDDHHASEVGGGGGRHRLHTALWRH